MKQTILADGSVLVGGTDGNLRTADASPDGLYVADTRILRAWELTVDVGGPVVAVGRHEEPTRRVLALAPAGCRNEDPGLVVVREQRARRGGLTETVTITATRAEPVEVTVALAAELDFADQFALRSDGRRWAPTGRVTASATGPVATVGYAAPAPAGEFTATATITLDGPFETSTAVGDDARSAAVGAVARLRVAPGDVVEVRVEVDAATRWVPGPDATAPTPSPGGATPDAPAPAGGPAAHGAAPEANRSVPRAGGPGRGAPPEPAGATARAALADLDALTIACPGRPDLRVPAAGSPWFVTLFGRDSLLTALLVEPERPDLLPHVVAALAHYQGTRTDPARLEAPGKIVHEIRVDELALRGDVPYGRYYGTVDATPLFVLGAGRLSHREDTPEDLLAALEAPVRAAVAWLRGDGGLDATGFVRYSAHTGGLVNQGWKDSEDAVSFATGERACGAIALAEVQGYTWRALREAASLARTRWDDPAWAAELDDVAADLAARFDAAFWLPDHDFPALALDGEDRPVDLLASNAGHLLWSGILAPERERAVADRLLDPAFFTGWGIRTIAAGQVSYRPGSYHNGSVWPHDTALAVEGLVTAGYPDHARRLAAGLAEAATRLGRLPELFSGLDRSAFPTPVAIPHAATPQAWAAAAAVVAARLSGD